MTRRRKVSAKDGEPVAPLAATISPNQPPTPDRNPAVAGMVRGAARGARGRFVKKSGGQPGNQSATTHGGRKERTKRGATKHTDAAVRKGQDRANRFWHVTHCHPEDARRRTLATYEAEIVRCEGMMGPDYKPHDRSLEVKPLTARFDALIEKRDALWAELRQMYCPTVPPAKAKVRFVALFSTMGGERAELVRPTGDAIDAKVCEAEDRHTAVAALESATLPTTDEHIKAWWSGRLQPKQREAPLNLPELDALPLGDVAESDAEEPAPLVVPADVPVPVEVDPPHVADPQPQSIPIAPYLGTREHRSFDGGGGRR